MDRTVVTGLSDGCGRGKSSSASTTTCAMERRRCFAALDTQSVRVIGQRHRLASGDRWFASLTEKQLRRGIHRSTKVEHRGPAWTGTGSSGGSDSAGDPARVTDVSAPFAISLNAVSKHVKVSESAALVGRPDGDMSTSWS